MTTSNALALTIVATGPGIDLDAFLDSRLRPGILWNLDTQLGLTVSRPSPISTRPDGPSSVMLTATTPADAISGLWPDLWDIARFIADHLGENWPSLTVLTAAGIGGDESLATYNLSHGGDYLGWTVVEATNAQPNMLIFDAVGLLHRGVRSGSWIDLPDTLIGAPAPQAVTTLFASIASEGSTRELCLLSPAGVCSEQLDEIQDAGYDCHAAETALEWDLVCVRK